MAKASEAKFVGWSKGWSPEDYNVLFSAGAILSSFGRCDLSEKHCLDVGGGIGSFASFIADITDMSVDVIDPSSLAWSNFIDNKKVNLIRDDFMNFSSNRQYDIISINLVLHHVIDPAGHQDRTLLLQSAFLSKAKSLLAKNGLLIIQENFYNGYFNTDIPGQLVNILTGSQLLSKILKPFANTAGEGVRFRSISKWIKILEACGFNVESSAMATKWGDWRLAVTKRFFFMKEGRQGVLICKIKE